MSEASAGRSTLDWGAVLRQVHLFTRETLLAMITVFEQT